MKTRTINIDAFHLEFQRGGGPGKFIAEIHGDTPGENTVQVKTKVNFTCLPYILSDLRKIWSEERETRVNEIFRIDNSLGK